MDLETQIIQHLTDAVLDTIQITTNVATVVVEGPLQFKDHSIINAQTSFSGQLEGFVQFSIGDKSAQRLVSHMINEDLNEESLQIKDGISEISSIIAGRLKSFLTPKGYTYNIGLPKILVTHYHMYTERDQEFTILEKNFICEELIFKASVYYKLVDLEAVEKSLEDVAAEIDAEMLLRQALEEELKD